MQTISGRNQMRLVCRQTAAGVTIIQVQTEDAHVVLPETLFGKPVVCIGDHAFAPLRRAAEGDVVQVTCGPVSTQETYDTRKICTVRIPATVRQVCDYAFYNCTGLHTLYMTDKTQVWSNCALMNCKALRTIDLTLSDAGAESLAYFTDVLPRELDAVLTYPDGGRAHLVFPEYQEAYEENTPARYFDYHIYGAGYPYHHCFRDKLLSLSVYDGLWEKLLQMEYEPLCALRLAYHRLREPYGLGEEARQAYLQFLQEHAAQAVQWLLSCADTRGLSWLLDTVCLEQEALHQACQTARAQNAAEALALLLEHQHRHFPAGQSKAFDL